MRAAIYERNVINGSPRKRTSRNVRFVQFEWTPVLLMPNRGLSYSTTFAL